MNTILETKSLTKSYNGINAVDDVSVSLYGERVVGLVGPNGAGKTTLFRLLGDAVKPTSGSAFVNGAEVGEKTNADVVYVPDKSNLFRWMRVEEHIRWCADMHKGFDEEKAHALCAELGIDEKAKIQRFSKGYEERVMLMLALARSASLYLLDEPLVGLDPEAKRLVSGIIRRQAAPGRTIIISTHLLRDMEELFDEVAFMQSGKVIEMRAADEIREEAGTSIDNYYLGVMQK